jgi:hypothetical protein
MTLWIAGRYRFNEGWQIKGVFSTRAIAVASCKERLEFVAPFKLDEDWSAHNGPMVGQYYPLIEDEKGEILPEEAARRKAELNI